MKTKFNIISEPVRSGKTSQLAKWLIAHPSVFGILMPDLANKRKIYFNKQGLVLPLQVIETEYTEAELFQIGRFSFLKQNFHLAQSLLLEAVKDESCDILVDEIGKLEYRFSMGFEPGLSIAIKSLKTSHKERTCYLVIRDYLLAEAKEYYNLQKAIVISSKQLQTRVTKEELGFSGLVMCGGASRRMKQPKALLSYHALPQYLWLNLLLQPLVNCVFISCKKEQASWFDQSLNQLHDNPKFEDAGPLAGLITLMETNTDKAILLVGCDYPLLQREHILQLTEACQLFESSVALSKGINEPLEPMLSCIHPKDFAAIKKSYHEEKQNSLSKILVALMALKIVVEKPNELKSFDTPEDFASFNLES